MYSCVPVSHCLHELLGGSFATVFVCTCTCPLVCLCLSVSVYTCVPVSLVFHCKVTKKNLLPQIEMNYSFVAMVTGVNKKTYEKQILTSG